MNNQTKSTNTSIEQSYINAAEEIQNLFDDLGYTSSDRHEGEMVKKLIVDIIQKKVDRCVVKIPFDTV